MARRAFLWRNSLLFPPLAKRRQPYAFYATMRRDQPVARDDTYGLWAVYRYDDVKRVLSDYHTFSSELSQTANRQFTSPIRPLRDNSLLGTDPPRHRQLRDLVSRAFTPRAVASLEPRIAQIADELIDQVVGKGSMDLVRDLADPLPVTVIAEMLGIPAGDRARFKRWSDDMVGESAAIYDPGAAGELARRRSSIEAMNQYFCRIIAERRQNPRGDLISGLIQAEIAGQRLTDDSLLAFCDLLLIAGNVTTTNL
ncbi:MAG TPA: cytochrome P450, partial [Chloroflexota bacterium]|nr:cytochrome P450 [Chloroflexota bacterium]